MSKAWFDKKINCKLIIEKTIDPSVDSPFHLSTAFWRLGWEPILTLRPYYYLELVCHFNANILARGKKVTDIHSSVKGVPSLINRAILARIFGFSNYGDGVEFGGDMVHSDRNYSIDIAFTCFDIRLTPRFANPDRFEIHAHGLCLHHRLLEYLLSFNVMP